MSMLKNRKSYVLRAAEISKTFLEAMDSSGNSTVKNEQTGVHAL